MIERIIVQQGRESTIWVYYYFLWVRNHEALSINSKRSSPLLLLPEDSGIERSPMILLSSSLFWICEREKKRGLILFALQAKHQWGTSHQEYGLYTFYIFLVGWLFGVFITYCLFKLSYCTFTIASQPIGCHTVHF